MSKTTFNERDLQKLSTTLLFQLQVEKKKLFELQDSRLDEDGDPTGEEKSYKEDYLEHSISELERLRDMIAQMITETIMTYSDEELDNRY